MNSKIKNLLFILVLCLGCSSNDNSTDNSELPIVTVNTISTLEYIDEFIIPDQDKNGIPIGGFSGIDYKNSTWYIISDGSDPLRYYTADIVYNENEFTTATISTMIEIKDPLGNSYPENQVDPEDIRFDTSTGTIIYTSEGSIANGIDPALLAVNANGIELQRFTLPANLSANIIDDQSGPRHNGALEALSISYDTEGYWIGMELPLIEDGPQPITTDTESPVRITRIHKTTGIVEKQFAYELAPVDREPALETTFTINGLVAILEYDEQKC